MKKIIIFLSHPVVQILSFSCILANNEKLGAPFLLFIIIGFFFFAFHSLLGIVAIVITAISIRRNNKFIQMIGYLCMAGSLVRFFTQPEDGKLLFQNTISEPVSVGTLVFFLIVGLVVCIRAVSGWVVKRQNALGRTNS